MTKTLTSDDKATNKEFKNKYKKFEPKVYTPEIVFRGVAINSGHTVEGGYYQEPAPPVCIGKPDPAKHWIVCLDPRFGTPDWNMPYQLAQAEVHEESVKQYTYFNALGVDQDKQEKIFDGDRVKLHTSAPSPWEGFEGTVQSVDGCWKVVNQDDEILLFQESDWWELITEEEAE